MSKLHDRSGIELAVGRPLFPVAALRSMDWIAGGDTSWTMADEDVLDDEPMLVMLWKSATADTTDITDEDDRDLYLGDCESAGLAAALLAEAALEFLQEGPIAHWWEAAGEEDAKITVDMAFGVRLATQAVQIGRLAAGAVVHLLSGGEETGPAPKVETEASWRARAKAAGAR